jgi:Uma2 family endonuclease
MTSVTTVPVEAYLRSTYEPDAEYVDGEIQERFVGEYDHASWQAALLEYFIKHKQDWNIRVLAELRVQVAATRFRVPDVTVLDRDRPIEQIITQPPLAVFEILSPEDTMARVLEKLRDYESMGIVGIFLVDPKNDARYQFHAGALLKLGADPVSIGRLTVDFEAIEALLD